MADTGQDVTIYGGSTVAIDLTLFAADGTPLDITGSTLEWGMAPKGAVDATVTKTTANSAQIQVTNAAGGLATVHLLPADTATLVGEYRHELRITDAGGNIETLLTGTLTIRTSILD